MYVHSVQKTKRLPSVQMCSPHPLPAHLGMRPINPTDFNKTDMLIKIKYIAEYHVQKINLDHGLNTSDVVDKMAKL